MQVFSEPKPLGNDKFHIGKQTSKLAVKNNDLAGNANESSGKGTIRAADFTPPTSDQVGVSREAHLAPISQQLAALTTLIQSKISD